MSSPSTIPARRKNIIAGLIAITLVAGVVTVGINFAFGEFDTGYEIEASFAAAGQGLGADSDVKIRGVNVGEVLKVELIDGRALVTMRIADGESVPEGAQATIRAKTLFGEKYVDIIPGVGEREGPFLTDGDEITDTQSAFELEQVLSDAFPILEEIDPQELMSVLGELADGGDGLGEQINRGIVNQEQILAVQAAHDADLREFLSDFGLLSEELAGRADDVTKLAADANVALPTLAENSDALNALLVQTGRLATDVADLLESNVGFIDTSFAEGQATLDMLDAHRDGINPLVTGLRQYLQTLTEAGHIPKGDGTILAGVKGVIGADLCDIPLLCNGLFDLGGLPALPTLPRLPNLPLDQGVTTAAPTNLVTGLTDGVTGIVELLKGLLG